MTWFRRVRSAFVWTSANEAPRGFIAAAVTWWTVGYMSALVWETTGKMFEDISQITMPAATAYATLMGTGLVGAWAFFRWARGDRDVPYEIKNKSMPVDHEQSGYAPQGRF